MIRIEAINFDPHQIKESGQCFRWDNPSEGIFLVPAFGRRLEIRQEKDELCFDCTDEEWEDVWRSYFDLDTDYGAIGRAIYASGDAYLRDAFEKGSGIRILRQDLWEVIISFMISQNNNIPRISGSVEKLCSRCTSDGHFPAPCEIDPDIFDDRTLGLGYRAPYIRDMVIYATEHPDFVGELAAMDSEKALERLLGFKGIGRKVANCISLFGLHDIDAFPIDTHIKKVLDREYPDGFDTERYAGFAGIVQQYMFYSERFRVKA